MFHPFPLGNRGQDSELSQIRMSQWFCTAEFGGRGHEFSWAQAVRRPVVWGRGFAVSCQQLGLMFLTCNSVLRFPMKKPVPTRKKKKGKKERQKTEKNGQVSGVFPPFPRSRRSIRAARVRSTSGCWHSSTAPPAAKRVTPPAR